MTETTPNAIGSVWEIKTKADRVAVTSPDGNTRDFAAFDGRAIVVLDSAGEWSAEIDGKPVTVKAG